MEQATEMARYAALCADYIDLDEIESFAVERPVFGDHTRVTFRFKNAPPVSYLVELEKERDRPIGQSLPW